MSGDWAGSFQPGIMLGYHVKELVYLGATYQLSDSITRNGSSFNARGLRRNGPLSSH